MSFGCHSGNNPILSLENGGTLFVGGWSKDPEVMPGMAIIDLTGNHTFAADVKGTGVFAEFADLFIPPTDILYFPLKDYAVPKYTLSEWTRLAATIIDVLKFGKDVLMCCEGGHGRTGMAISIMGSLMADWGYFTSPDEVEEWKSPVKHVREIYCTNAVDTEAQENYVYRILGLDLKADPEDYKVASTGAGWQTGAIWKDGAWVQPNQVGKVLTGVNDPFIDANTNNKVMDCPFCHTKDSPEAYKYGMCAQCQKEYGEEIEKKAKEREIDPEIVILDCFLAECQGECDGIIKATCGHVVHDQPGSFGLKCDHCHNMSVKLKHL